MAREFSTATVSQVIAERGLTAEMRSSLTAQYAEWIDGPLRTRWLAAMEQGGSMLPRPVWALLSRENVGKWIDTRSKFLLKSMPDQQAKAIKRIVRFFAVDEPVSAGTLAEILRPAIGLTEAQAATLISQSRELLAEGLTRSQVALKLGTVASRLNKTRALRIARTELATAHNGAIQLAIEDAVRDGAFGDSAIARVWRTQEDERVCPICEPLDGQVVGLEDPFRATTTDRDGDERVLFDGPLPPAHVSCRCVIIYEERAR
jgi:hypothetical protein